MRQQLVGPKAFPMERMLAIFYSIIDEELEDSIDIQLQVKMINICVENIGANIVFCIRRSQV